MGSRTLLGFGAREKHGPAARLQRRPGRREAVHSRLRRIISVLRAARLRAPLFVGIGVPPGFHNFLLARGGRLMADGFLFSCPSFLLLAPVMPAGK